MTDISLLLLPVTDILVLAFYIFQVKVGEAKDMKLKTCNLLTATSDLLVASAPRAVLYGTEEFSVLFIVHLKSNVIVVKCVHCLFLWVVTCFLCSQVLLLLY